MFRGLRSGPCPEWVRRAWVQCWFSVELRLAKTWGGWHKFRMGFRWICIESVVSGSAGHWFWIDLRVLCAGFGLISWAPGKELGSMVWVDSFGWRIDLKLVFGWLLVDLGLVGLDLGLGQGGRAGA